jgi:hypothetical protein
MNGIEARCWTGRRIEGIFVLGKASLNRAFRS